MSETTWTFAVDQTTGAVAVTCVAGSIFLGVMMDPEDFQHFAGMVNGALGDSKMAAS
jgi:hypothetical protein